MSPMAFLATASGLMIERVRSTAIFWLRQDKSEQIQNSNTRSMSAGSLRAREFGVSMPARARPPIERESGLVARASETGIDPDARDRRQHFIAVDARASDPIPFGDAGFAQQVGDATVRRVPGQSQPLGRYARADGDARRG